MAEFSDVTPEQMKCLVWICGLVAPQDADVRARALRKMEDNLQTTLKELAAEVQHFLDIRQDATLLERSSVPHINVVDSQKSRNREPPSLFSLWSQSLVQRLHIRKQEPRLQTLWTQARILQKFPGEEAEICQHHHYSFDSC
ncbi:hypothetical protein RB195_023695 [Necator americanus]|uniref:Uncharacterized protein n=1 Tax=Necator americanus TaxID=51031 RepID=A0ABR1EKQ5_NECAM